MPKRTSEEYASQVATEDVMLIAAELEQKQGNGSQETTQAEVVKLLAAILNQVRNEAVLRPPSLTAAAEEAVRQYGIMSAAMNPGRSPLVAQFNG
jgi:hypothetical protein